MNDFYQPAEILVIELSSITSNKQIMNEEYEEYIDKKINALPEDLKKAVLEAQQQQSKKDLFRAIEQLNDDSYYGIEIIFAKQEFEELFNTYAANVIEKSEGNLPKLDEQEKRKFKSLWQYARSYDFENKKEEFFNLLDRIIITEDINNAQEMLAEVEQEEKEEGQEKEEEKEEEEQTAPYFPQNKKTKSNEVSMEDLKERFIETTKADDQKNKKKEIDRLFALFAYTFRVKDAHKDLSKPKELTEDQQKELGEYIQTIDTLENKELEKFFELFDWCVLTAHQTPAEMLSGSIDNMKAQIGEKYQECEEYINEKINALPEDQKKAVLEAQQQ